jgi:hypothetical protein
MLSGRSVTGMVAFVSELLSWLAGRFRNRAELELEVIALRHQLAVLRRQRPGRPRLSARRTRFYQSAYWLLHAFATDLAIYVKNGAPISSSNHTGTVWVLKKGTVTSIQGLAGVQQGESGPGFWTIFALINHSWGASGNGETAVLQYVKAIDAITQVLAQQAQQGSGGGTGGGSGGGTPTPPPNPFACNTGNPDQDEPGDLCQTMSFQLSLIYDLLTQIGKNASASQSDTCCTAVVQAIASITSELTIIAQAILNPPTTNDKIDLTPIVTALQALVTAAMAFPATETAIGDLLATGLDKIATAITASLAVNVSGIVDALNTIGDQGDVDQFIFAALQVVL